MKTKIYALRGDNRFVRYVGKTTKSLGSRLSDHLAAARRGDNSHKGRGIRKMLSLGSIPSITLIEIVEGNGSKEERYWIKYLRSHKINLWNETEGGEGIAGFHHNKWTRKRIGASNKISHNRPETRRLMSVLQKERMKDPVNRMRISKSLQGHPTTEKVREANRNKILSIETRKKMGSGMRGKKVSPEVIEKRRKAMLGHSISAETRAKISASHIGIRPSKEARLKMRLAKVGKIPWNKGLRYKLQERIV